MKFLYHLFLISYRVQQWSLKRLTPAGWGVLICLMATAVVGIDTKQTTAYQILTFLLAVLIVAVAFSCYFPSRLIVQRSLPKFATVGFKLSYRVTITNKSRVKETGLLFLEEIAHPKFSLAEFRQIIKAASKKGSINSLIYIYYRWLKTISRQKKAKTKAIALPTLKAQSTTEVKGEIIPTHRGVVRLKGITILRPDPFNLFNASRTIHQPGSLLVLPKRYQLPTIQLPGSRVAQSGTISQAASKGDSAEFVALRDYRPGDPLRKIHWKSWAKTGKPIVKVEQSEFFVRQALILDTFQSADRSEILEEAIAVAASFACNLQTQESLLDLMFVGLDSYSFPADSFGNDERMLEILAGVTAQDNTCDSLTAAIAQKASMLSSCICILIGWDEHRQKLISYLQKLNIPLLILLITEDEQRYPDLNIENLYTLPLGKIQTALMTIKTKY